MELSYVAPLKFSTRTNALADWPIQVLLVEDNEEAAWLVQGSLIGPSRDPFLVEWAASATHAVNRLATPGIDVILLDLGLPELNGYRSFRAIDIACGSKIPVVILTSDGRPVSRDLTLGCGASAYLIKDRVSPVQLRECLLSAVLHGRPQLQ